MNGDYTTDRPGMALDVEQPDAAAQLARTKPLRPWRYKFRDAFKGIKSGIRGHSSFFVHFFFAALVVAAAVVLRCGLVDWCILILCMGMVLTAELFNSAFETLFRGLDEATRDRAFRSLDIAAGAVLLASITAAIVGLLVFINRLIEILGLFETAT